MNIKYILKFGDVAGGKKNRDSADREKKTKLQCLTVKKRGGRGGDFHAFSNRNETNAMNHEAKESPRTRECEISEPALSWLARKFLT